MKLDECTKALREGSALKSVSSWSPLQATAKVTVPLVYPIDLVYATCAHSYTTHTKRRTAGV